MLTIKEAMQEFTNLTQPFGSLDLETSLEQLQTMKEIDSEQFEKEFDTCLISEALFDILNEQKESYGYDTIMDLDPVYEVMEHALQMARNFIEEKISYDFINDLKTGTTEIYTHGNYMASNYDWSEEAKEELISKIEASEYTVEQLASENIFVNYLFENIDL